MKFKAAAFDILYNVFDSNTSVQHEGDQTETTKNSYPICQKCLVFLKVPSESVKIFGCRAIAMFNCD